MELGVPYGVEGIVSNRGKHGFLKDFMVDHVEDEGGY